jgi:hypothetical protein
MKVERWGVGELEKQEWDFGVTTRATTDQISVFLRRYRKSERQSKRHNFKQVQIFDSNRINDTGRGVLSNKEQVHTPQDVLEEVKQKIIDSIQFRD